MNLILTGGNSMFILIAYVVIFGGIMYFLAIRPQRKEQKRMQAMLMDMEMCIRDRRQSSWQRSYRKKDRMCA